MQHTYDPSNIFAKILAGSMPSHKVYEDSTAVAIMDVFPQARGHVLVIPRAASRNLLDADPAVLSAVITLVQRLARAVLKATLADGIRLIQYNEAPAGQSVFHLHFHLIPAYDGDGLRPHASSRADDNELAALAATIRSTLEQTP